MSSTAFKQPTGVNAGILGNEPNIGVKGMRFRARTDSDVLRTFENPQDTLAEKGKNDVKSSIWGSEDEAEIARKYENWKRARAKQMADCNRMLSAKDMAKVAALTIATRLIFNRLGLSFRRVALPIITVAICRALYNAAAKRRNFPPNDYPSYPFFGQIGVIQDFLKIGGATFQVIRAKRNNFTTDEVVVLGNPRDTFLMDPRDREYMLKTNWKNYAKNYTDGTGFQENFAEVMGRGIFAVDGDEWQDHRKVASHLFSANGLKSKMEKSFVAHGAKLVKLLEEKAKMGATLDFQDAMASLTFETICDIAFGVDTGAMEASFKDGRKIDFLLRFDRIQQLSVLRFFYPQFLWKAMRFLNIGHERVLREDTVEINKYVTGIIRRRFAEPDFDNADDLLAMYVRTGKSSGKLYMTEEDYLFDAILNFMIAGRDTTSCTLTNLFKLLPTNPEVEQKMLEELDSIVGRGNHVNWDHIRELRYCGAVFNEVLRMYPPVAGDSRTALKDDVMPSGVKIEAGQRVSILNSAIGRDPHLWDEPDKFLPERWLQEGKPTRRPDEYIFPVFWAGPRLCLGKDMARLEAISIAYIVLCKYRVEILPHADKVVNGPVQFYEHGLPVKVHIRT